MTNFNIKKLFVFVAACFMTFGSQVSLAEDDSEQTFAFRFKPTVETCKGAGDSGGYFVTCEVVLGEVDAGVKFTSLRFQKKDAIFTPATNISRPVRVNGNELEIVFDVTDLDTTVYDVKGEVDWMNKAYSQDEYRDHNIFVVTYEGPSIEINQDLELVD